MWPQHSAWCVLLSINAVGLLQVLRGHLELGREESQSHRTTGENVGVRLGLEGGERGEAV